MQSAVCVSLHHKFNLTITALLFGIWFFFFLSLPLTPVSSLLPLCEILLSRQVSTVHSLRAWAFLRAHVRVRACDRASLMIKTALCSRGLYTAQWQGNGEPRSTHNDLCSINICFIINQRPRCYFDYRSLPGYSTDKRSMDSFFHIKCSRRCRFPFSLYVLNVSLSDQGCVLCISGNWGWGGWKCLN